MRIKSTLVAVVVFACPILGPGKAVAGNFDIGGPPPATKAVTAGEPPSPNGIQTQPPASKPAPVDDRRLDPFLKPVQSTAALEDYWCGSDQPTALPDGGRGAGGQFWLRAEYLLWWTRGSQSPPLITTGVPGLSPLPGTLGQTGTSVLYDGSRYDRSPRSGGRFTAGFWLDPCRMVGVEGSYFFLGNRTTRFDASSDARLGSQLLARPFFDVLTSTQNAQLVAFPALANGTNILSATGTGLASGSIHASTYSRLQGADLNALCGLCSGCDYWVQMLAGFRYLNLEEGIAISETTTVNSALPSGAPLFGGSTISITDRFDTRNNFYGGQVGLRGEVRRGRMFLEVQSKLAFGVTHQVVDIRGSTAITSASGATSEVPVGFLSSGSNSGHYTRDRFSVVPEVGANAGILLTDNLRAFVGYNFLYWSSVVRPGDQIDTRLNGSQIPTDTRYDANATYRPSATIRDSGFWVQGISFGVELRY